jgi:hypothetical protein
MARKKVDPLKAKAAKQKKMAIGLSVLFVLVLAYQGPKTLKMLKGPAVPAATPVPAPVIDPATGVPEGTVPPLGAPAVAAGAPATPTSAEPAVLGSSEQPLAGGPGQLLSFELFESKDPFAQQVKAGSTVGTPEPAEGAGGTAAGADPNPPAAAAGETPAPAAGGGSAIPPAAGGGSSPTPPAPAAAGQVPAATTAISVNGVSGPVEIGKGFPLEDPVLVLVSAALDGKSVKIGIAGGAYADGASTITLKIGKPLTLQNTADGTRYELLLETVAGFVPPASKK